MKPIIFLFLLLALLLTACGAGSNSAPNEYKVSNISYAFDAANPSNLTTVAFDLDNPALSVKVSVPADGVLQACTSATPFTHWTCALAGVTMTGGASPSSLRVVATQ